MTDFMTDQLGKVSMTDLEELKSNGQRLGYVDVHAHLIHDRFENREDEIAVDCIRKGMDFVIVNGIEPKSNRRILEFCEKFAPYMQPAIGIYPLDACNQFIFTEEDSSLPAGETPSSFFFFLHSTSRYYWMSIDGSISNKSDSFEQSCSS